MDSLIPVINNLHDIFATIGTNPLNFDLPQIVVVGSQSSGKSSVLESIVGKDFLPRGKGLSTRRPLILQLIHLKEGKEYGVFSHSNKKFTDFENIKNEIIGETKKSTDSLESISGRPINLKIYSPRVINLTLIDLPGITKIAVGDQPSDIEKKIRQIVVTYASNPNSIILAIVPANADPATSDALQIAKELDPSNDRTLGVLTKIDLMDEGQNALDILNGKVFPLKYGYIGVKNRSQLDITNNVSVKNGLEMEEKFFANNKFYKPLKDKLGTKYLTKSLNRILISHIKTTLPKIKFYIKSMICELQNNHNFSNNELNSSKKPMTMLSILSKFNKTFCDAIDGKELTEVANKKLFGGACISRIFHEDFKTVIMDFDPLSKLNDDKIRTAIKNATGPKPSLFVPELSFETLTKQQIIKFKKPSLECVDSIFEELVKVARNSFPSEIKNYSNLQDRMNDCVIDVLRDLKKPTIEMVQNIIEMELSYINTNHPNFVGGSNSIPLALSSLNKIEFKSKINEEKNLKMEKNLQNGKNVTAQKFEREIVEIEIIKTLIKSYFEIVKKNIADSIPKAIMCFLVNKAKKQMLNQLVSSLYKEEMFDKLLKIDPEKERERVRDEEMLKILKKALEIVKGVRDYTI